MGSGGLVFVDIHFCISMRASVLMVSCVAYTGKYAVSIFPTDVYVVSTSSCTIRKRSM